ncbi:MAG: myristoyl transferase [Planctomycetaceae bacterium]|nr:myristoyl transferase [Planctomycetaceae bacterium]
MNKTYSHLTILFLVCFGGCQNDDSSVSIEQPKDTPAPLTRVTLQLNWFPEAEHGGYYAALVHGIFEEEGLDVEIRGGGPNSPVIQQLVSGQADFIIGNADQVLTSRAKDSNAVALLAPLQTSPRCIMVHESSGIETLHDLSNMTLGMSAGRAFALYMQKHLPMENVKLVGYPGSPAIFLNDESFGQQAYVFSEPFVAKQSGGDPKVLMVSDLGYNPYTSLLITTQKNLTENRDLIDRMVRASRKGWIKYLQSPADTNKHLHALNEEMGLDILAFGAETLRNLCLPENMPEEQLGQMTADRWQQLRDQLIEIELIDETVDANSAFIK